eukprot:jgi/Botrbrau1/10916/Bobra.0025s0089.1
MRRFRLGCWCTTGLICCLLVVSSETNKNHALYSQLRDQGEEVDNSGGQTLVKLFTNDQWTHRPVSSQPSDRQLYSVGLEKVQELNSGRQERTHSSNGPEQLNRIPFLRYSAAQDSHQTTYLGLDNTDAGHLPPELQLGWTSGESLSILTGVQAPEIPVVHGQEFFPDALQYALITSGAAAKRRRLSWRYENEPPERERGRDKYNMAGSAIAAEAEEEEGEDEEDDNSPPLLGGPGNLDEEETEVRGVDAFAQWAAQFGPNGTKMFQEDLAISQEEARKKDWGASAMFDPNVDLSGDIPLKEGYGGPFFARAFIATVALGERHPFLAPGQEPARLGPRVWEDSPEFNTSANMSGLVRMKEGFGGSYFALAKAFNDPVGVRRPFLAPGVVLKDMWIINRGAGPREKAPDSPEFNSSFAAPGEIEPTLGFGGPFVARAACGSTPLGTRRPFQLPVVRGQRPRADPFNILGIDEVEIFAVGGASTSRLPGVVRRPFKEIRDANTTFNRVPDRPRPPPPPARKYRKYVMPIPPSPPPSPAVSSPSERQRRKHEEGPMKYGPRLSQNWFFFHEKLVDELKEAESEGGWDVLFLGDSLFEPWRGTKMDQSWAAYADVPATWDASFGKVYGRKAHVMAISGDGVKNIMWRLVNGEMPSRIPPR